MSALQRSVEELHPHMISKIRLDQRGKDRLIHSGWGQRERNFLEWALMLAHLAMISSTMKRSGY